MKARWDAATPLPVPPAPDSAVQVRLPPPPALPADLTPPPRRKRNAYDEADAVVPTVLVGKRPGPYVPRTPVFIDSEARRILRVEREALLAAKRGPVRGSTPYADGIERNRFGTRLMQSKCAAHGCGKPFKTTCKTQEACSRSCGWALRRQRAQETSATAPNP